jgi:hypothetical protein
LKLQRLELFVAALWWGSLTTLGFGVVPLLFARLGSPAQAGQMAAQLFSAQTWVWLVLADGTAPTKSGTRLGLDLGRHVARLAG